MITVTLKNGARIELTVAQYLVSNLSAVCGYKYGSKWLKREVPAEVLEFLRTLPDTDTKPAWV